MKSSISGIRFRRRADAAGTAAACSCTNPSASTNGREQQPEIEAVGGDAGGPLVLAGTDRARDQRRGADPEADAEIGDHRRHRQGEAERGQRVGTEQADEEGVGER